MKKKFFVLWSAGILSTIVALPYILTLQSAVLEKSTTPLWQIILISVAQSALLLAVAVFFGLKLMRAIGLPAISFLGSGFFSKTRIKEILKLAVPLGISIALAIKILDVFFLQYIPQLAIAASKIAFWKTILVAPYGGVVEELLMRLFLVSLFAWLLGKIFRKREVTNNKLIMWSAIILTAVIFGLGHLPATATIVQITPIVLFRAILLNGMGGLVFGWLYWKKGLEYAIVAHFTADIFIHTVLPAFLK